MALDFIRSHPLLTLGLATVPVGVYAGVQGFRSDNRNPDLTDRSARAAVTGVRGVGFGLGVGLLGMAAWKGRSAVASSAGAAGNYIAGGFAQVSAATKAGNSVFRSVTGNPRVMGTGGLLAGAAVGAAYGHPFIGAAAGFGAGLATHVGIGVSRLPGAVKAGGVLALSTLVFAGVRAAGSPEVQSESIGVDDGLGGYDVSPSSSVKDRMNMLGATGDMVFGLNYGRH
jgi:hypothetical protein